MPAYGLKCSPQYRAREQECLLTRVERSEIVYKQHGSDKKSRCHWLDGTGILVKMLGVLFLVTKGNRATLLRTSPLPGEISALWEAPYVCTYMYV